MSPQTIGLRLWSGSWTLIDEVSDRSSGSVTTLTVVSERPSMTSLRLGPDPRVPHGRLVAARAGVDVRGQGGRHALAERERHRHVLPTRDQPGRARRRRSDGPARARPRAARAAWAARGRGVGRRGASSRPAPASASTPARSAQQGQEHRHGLGAFHIAGSPPLDDSLVLEGRAPTGLTDRFRRRGAFEDEDARVLLGDVDGAAPPDRHALAPQFLDGAVAPARPRRRSTPGSAASSAARRGRSSCAAAVVRQPHRVED